RRRREERSGRGGGAAGNRNQRRLSDFRSPVRFAGLGPVMVFRSLVLACFLLSRAALADTVSIDGSVLGFFFDPTQGLQPILGITGSSTIGPPLNLQVGFSSVVISPRQDYALAITAPGASVMEVSLGRSASIAQIAAPVQPADLTALSPAGSAAALYDRLQNKIQVISSLPSAPALAREVD